MPPAIRADQIGKMYRVSHGAPRVRYRLLRDAITATLTAPFRRAFGNAPPGITYEDFWALKEVSFEVQPGEVVGIIGRNGAGKSTLLKVLSRIIKPSAGRCEINGRVGSLLEVGTGFHPELTGRENVFLNGSLLGMSRREIHAKFDAIVEFAEVEQFLDTPVKRYSSGMYVRLAFAVAAHLEPEILIVDEVLAVGDAGFQRKCIEKMQDVGRSGRTILFVSHQLTVVENLCTRAIFLDRGQVKSSGSAAEIIENYLTTYRESAVDRIDLRTHEHRLRHTKPILTALSISTRGRPGAVIEMGADFAIAIEYELAAKPKDLRVGIVIEDLYGMKVTAISPTFQAPAVLANAPASGTIVAAVPWHNLVAGQYHVNVYAQADQEHDAIEHAMRLEVIANDTFSSFRTLDYRIARTFLPCEWKPAWRAAEPDR